MTIELNETLDLAGLNVRYILKDHVGLDVLIKLTGRIATIKAMLPINPAEAMATVWQFKYDLDGLGDYTDDVHQISCEVYTAVKDWYDRNQKALAAGRKYWDRGDVDPVCVGRWESRGGKHYVELWWGRYDYYYRANNAGGSVCGPNETIESAVRVVQSMLDRGLFLPDNAIVPMTRVR